MAKVMVRIKIDRTFEIICDGTDAEECAEDIMENDLLQGEIDLDQYFEIVVSESTFDEPDTEDELAEEAERKRE